MKILCAYGLLVAWMGYLYMGSINPVLNGKKPFGAMVGSIQKTEKGQHSCCSAKEEATPLKSDCGGEEKEKSCCGDSYCTRICCQPGFAATGPGGDFVCLFSIISSSSNEMQYTLLPNPYIGRLYPPPNHQPFS